MKREHVRLEVPPPPPSGSPDSRPPADFLKVERHPIADIIGGRMTVAQQAPLSVIPAVPSRGASNDERARGCMLSVTVSRRLTRERERESFEADLNSRFETGASLLNASCARHHLRTASAAKLGKTHEERTSCGKRPSE